MGNEGGRRRVLIVDDHELVRAGLRSLLESVVGFEVCGESASVAAAMEVARRTRPDIVLLDLVLADGEGTSMIAPLRAAQPEVRVLVMSMHDEDVWGRLVTAAGADGFVQKDADPDTLVAAITAVGGGQRWLRGGIADPSAEPADERTVGLSEREREVLAGVADGLSAKEIAARIGVMPATVDSHKRNIRAKLGVQSMAELILWAQALRRRAEPDDSADG